MAAICKLAKACTSLKGAARAPGYIGPYGTGFDSRQVYADAGLYGEGFESPLVHYENRRQF